MSLELDLGGVLAYLAGEGDSTGYNSGGDLCANLAWPAVNGHGIAPATPAYLSLVGALNYKAGTTGQDINLVCNTLAGTTGLEPDLALRVYAGIQ